jgi:hypothetical protein
MDKRKHQVMEKKVTKEELGQALLKVLGQSVPYSRHEEILNELFPPDFKVGDKVIVIPTGNLREIESFEDNKVWLTNRSWTRKDGLRHATPEEIAEAEWEEGAVYKVERGDAWVVRVASDKVGWFYYDGAFEGKTTKYNTYEKI